MSQTIINIILFLLPASLLAGRFILPKRIYSCLPFRRTERPRGGVS